MYLMRNSDLKTMRLYYHYNTVRIVERNMNVLRIG